MEKIYTYFWYTHKKRNVIFLFQVIKSTKRISIFSFFLFQFHMKNHAVSSFRRAIFIAWKYLRPSLYFVSRWRVFVFLIFPCFSIYSTTTPPLLPLLPPPPPNHHRIRVFISQSPTPISEIHSSSNADISNKRFFQYGERSKEIRRRRKGQKKRETFAIISLFFVIFFLGYMCVCV